MTQAILVPLAQLDQSYLHEVGVTLGHVVRSVDVPMLRAAAVRVIDKWRLLAGHLEWSKQLSSWCVNVPLHGDVSGRLGFTTNNLKLRLDTQFTVNEHAFAQVVTRPPLSLFRASSTPSDLQSYATSKAPIISIHITELLNCTCIGFSFPHGVLDAVGIGHFIHGLDDELNGRTWDAPAISTTNIVREALDTLEAAPTIYDDIHKETAAFSSFRRSLKPAFWANKLTLAPKIISEHIRHGIETKTVHLGEKAMGRLLRETKAEVAKLGVGRVSTGDILAAWIMKAMYADESDSNSVCLISMYSIRAMLEDKYPTIKDYPRKVDNGFTGYPLPPFTKGQLAKMSVAEIAILHRKGFEPTADIAWLQAYNTYLKKALRGHMTVKWNKTDDLWIFTNQVIGRVDNIDYGSKMFGVWVWFHPFEFPSEIGINKFKGGYLVQGTARSARWRAVAKAVENMDRPQPRL
ncbi:hypothetical protein H0H93_010845 [Arthromyces matolae]|nr:hypothetical protein H0H93_010845 [Arthromyces matolae]